MLWDAFFDDLEEQFASERDAERAALHAEGERLRLSRVALRDRLVLFADLDAEVSIDLSDRSTHRGRIAGVGADWVGVAPTGARARGLVVPVSSIEGIAVPGADLACSARRTAPAPGVGGRVTFGFVVRDVARRRAGVEIQLTRGRGLAGTIDRAGADHLDIALHELGTPRRADVITAHRIVPFAAISWMRIEGSTRWIDPAGRA